MEFFTYPLLRDGYDHVHLSGVSDDGDVRKSGDDVERKLGLYNLASYLLLFNNAGDTKITTRLKLSFLSYHCHIMVQSRFQLDNTVIIFSAPGRN